MLSNLINQLRIKLLVKGECMFILNHIHYLDIKESKEDRMKLVTDDNDKTSLLINYDWFSKLETENQLYALSHTVMHYALQHDIRKGNRNESMFQQASDIVVDNLLAEMGFKPAKSNAEYKNLPVELVYMYMEQKANQKPQNKENFHLCGNDMNFHEPSSIERIERNNTLVASKRNGFSLSGKADLDYLFNEITSGKLDWKTILFNYLDNFKGKSLSYKEFDRRMLQEDLYLPSYVEDLKIDKVTVAIDVSSSVSEEQIEVFLREVRKIKDDFNPSEIDLISFNHEIVETFTIKEDDDLSAVEMNIGGGTDLYPVFEWIDNQEIKPKFLIVFSDLYCDEIVNSPDYSVIWICIDNPQAHVNFGKLIHIKGSDLCKK